MKIITKNLIYFTLSMSIATLLFRYLLSTFLQNEMFTGVWILSIIYGASAFFLGSFFGKKDTQSLPIFDIGFRFHLATYIVCNGIGELWHVFQLHSQYEHIRTVHITVLIWSIFLFIHFYYFMRSRKKVYKGLRKTDLFD